MAGFFTTWMGGRKLRTIPDYTKALDDRLADKATLIAKKDAAWARRSTMLREGTVDDVRACEIEADNCRIEIEQLDEIRGDLERRLTELRADDDKRRIVQHHDEFNEAVKGITAEVEAIVARIARIHAPISALAAEGFRAEADNLPRPPNLLIDLAALNAGRLEVPSDWYQFEEAAAKSKKARGRKG